MIGGWRQDLEEHRELIREGVDLDYSIASILAIAEDAIRRFESTEEALRGNVAEAEKTAQKLEDSQYLLAECRQQLAGEEYQREELRTEVQRLTNLLSEVKEQVGRLMIEDMQRIQQLKVQGEELKAKDRILLVQGSEQVSLRQDIDELEKKAAGVRRKPEDRKSVV